MKLRNPKIKKLLSVALLAALIGIPIGQTANAMEISNNVPSYIENNPTTIEDLKSMTLNYLNQVQLHT